MLIYLSFCNCVAKKMFDLSFLRNNCVNQTSKLLCSTHPDLSFCVIFDLSVGFFCDNKNVSWKVTFTLNYHLQLWSIFIDINFAIFRFVIASDIASYIIVLPSSDGPGMTSFAREKGCSIFAFDFGETLNQNSSCF